MHTRIHALTPIGHFLPLQQNLKSYQEPIQHSDVQRVTNARTTRVIAAILGSTEPLVAVADLLGRSALHFAALYNNPAAARLLSRRLPDMVAMQDLAGMTAQDIAACSGFTEVCAVLSHAVADAADRDHSCECKRWEPLAEPLAEPLTAEGTGSKEPRDETGGWSTADQLPSNGNTDGVCEIDQRGADLTAAEFYQVSGLQVQPVYKVF
jgi:ankyrin repeat protein